MIKYDNMTDEQKAVYNFGAFVMRIISNHDMIKLLGEYESRTNVLSKTAPYFFFETLFDLLQRDFFLESAKIIEKASTFGNKNLNINYFLDMDCWTEEQKGKLKNYFQELHEFYKCIKPARDKIISHNDLPTYNNHANRGSFEEGKDDDFVKTLEDFYNYLHEITFGDIWGSFTPNVEAGGIQELIAFLYQGLAFEDIVNDETTSSEVTKLLLKKSLEIKKV